MIIARPMTTKYSEFIVVVSVVSYLAVSCLAESVAYHSNFCMRTQKRCHWAGWLIVCGVFRLPWAG